ncbi:MAG: efflux RND transporter periplasmic adaptor subunit [Bacteroidetes bacterium]|nr:MAG: efflux RND transporter periplasmic adaptor subunit [Bacteroidota bacterium]
MNKKTKYIILSVVALAAILALKFLQTNSSNENGKANGNPGTRREQKIPVTILVLKPETFSQRVSTVGTILSNEEVEIRSEISGKIESVQFTEGAKVKKGDILVNINDDELQARLLSAQSKLKLADLQQERQQQLVEKNLISQQEYDATVNELNVIKADLQLVQAQLNKTEIRAPFDGTIGLRYVSEGSYLSPTAIITTLQDYRTVKIDFTFPEKYAGEIREGDNIIFTAQSSTKKYAGKVYAIAPKIDPATRTLRIRAVSKNEDGLLVPGGFASVEVQLKEKETLTVPAFAVIPELKRHKVFLCINNKAVEKIIEVGDRTDERLEVRSGLQPGDSLITSAILQLRAGMSVQPKESKEDAPR